MRALGEQEAQLATPTGFASYLDVQRWL